MAKASGQAVQVGLTAWQRAGGMSRGQVVTVLVGLALCLHELHAARLLAGPFQPRDIVIDGVGRPGLLPAAHPVDWSRSQDVTALLRFGASLTPADPELAKLLRLRAASPRTSTSELAHWLLGLAAPEPLLLRQSGGGSRAAASAS
jgi:hypothetical protein